MTNDLVKRLRLPPFGTETSERNLMLAAADRIDALSEALTESRAETAAAYEAAARVTELFNLSFAFQSASSIRALATPDQTAALDRMIADAEARGMRRAAEIAEKQKEIFLSPEYAGRFPTNSFAERFACTEVSSAILADIPKGDDA